MYVREDLQPVDLSVVLMGTVIIARPQAAKKCVGMEDSSFWSATTETLTMGTVAHQHAKYSQAGHVLVVRRQHQPLVPPYVILDIPTIQLLTTVKRSVVMEKNLF